MNELRNERARRRRRERAKREGRETVDTSGRVPPERYLTARKLSDYAQATRQPGELLADALKRARRELSTIPVEIDGARSE